MVGPTKGKCPVACGNCRLKKAKCNGVKPCKSCQEQKLECFFPPPPQRSAPRRSRAKELERRFSLLEATIYGGQHAVAGSAGAGVVSTSPNNTQSVNHEDRFVNDQRHSISSSRQQEYDTHLPFVRRDSANSLSAPINIRQSPLDYNSAGDKPTSPQQLMPAPCASPGTNPHVAACPDGAVISEVIVPNAYFSIISEPAAKWVSLFTGVPHFSSAARRLAEDIMGNKKKQVVKPERMPEPDLETAMAWTAFFFERSWVSRLSLLERDAFEQRLRASFLKQDFGPHSDPTWYALRSTVYAIGYRGIVAESGRPYAFRDARASAWPYFENALSVHTEIVYAKGGLAEIQTLVLMAYYAEGLGDMSLEYMLVSNAVRLAYALGMHLSQSDTSAKSEDVGGRDALWWVLHAYDKHLACLSGRPSAIVDDDMSYVQRMSGAAESSGGRTRDDIVEVAHQHALISSQILKHCCTARALQQPPADLLAIIKDLDTRLRDWHDSLPPIYQCDPMHLPRRLPHETHQNSIIFASCVFNSDLILIHRPFTYHWNRVKYDPVVDAQGPVSTAIVADSARNILRAIEGITVTAAMPVWLAVYFPLVGLINLFLHVVQNPLSSATKSDIALMDVVVGHFSYLDFASGSELGTQFPREVVAYAREVTTRARLASDSTHPSDSSLEHENLVSSDERTSQEIKIHDSWMHDIFGIGSADPSPDYFMFSDVPPDLHDFLVQAWPSFLPP